MRTLSSAFLAEQKKLSFNPLVKLEVATYGHPAAVSAADLQWSAFTWERLTAADDATTLGLHSVAVPADGSVIRFRMVGDTTAMKIQRVASPSVSSDWTTWTSFGTALANSPVALAARNAEVIAFCSNGTYIYRRESADSGATWGSWTAMTNTRACELGLAACFKSNGDCAVIAASNANDPNSLYFYKRVSGTWTSDLGQIAGEYPISALAMYHEGDWNILALVLDGSYVRLARGIMGDGDQYAAGTFSGWSLSTAPGLRWISPHRCTFASSAAAGQVNISPPIMSWFPPSSNPGRLITSALTTRTCAITRPWELFSLLQEITGHGFIRLKPMTEFRDSDWHKAYPLEINTTYGLALACDGIYLYATAPNQVWRTALPGSWSPPAAGSGAGTFYTVPNAQLLRVNEQVAALAPSTLTITLDNSTGDYDLLGGGASLVGCLKRGSHYQALFRL